MFQMILMMNQKLQHPVANHNWIPLLGIHQERSPTHVYKALTLMTQ